MFNVFQALTSCLWDAAKLLLEAVSALIDRQLFIVALDITTVFDGLGISFQPMEVVIYTFAMYLIVLKFVRKIMDVYALQTDGDAGADIQVLITNFLKAMVIAMCFTTIWSWVLDIVLDFGNQLIAAVNYSSLGQQLESIEALGESNPGSASYVACAIFLLLAGFMHLTLLRDGLEFWIVRLGVPLACCGLLDADQGIFKQWMKLFLKEILTVLIRVVMLHVSLIFMSRMGMGDGNGLLYVIFAILSLVVAFTAPRTLSEFVFQHPSGGHKITTALYMGSNLFLRVV